MSSCLRVFSTIWVVQSVRAGCLNTFEHWLCIIFYVYPVLFLLILSLSLSFGSTLIKLGSELYNTIDQVTSQSYSIVADNLIWNHAIKEMRLPVRAFERRSKEGLLSCFRRASHSLDSYKKRNIWGGVWEFRYKYEDSRTSWRAFDITKTSLVNITALILAIKFFFSINLITNCWNPNFFSKWLLT